MKNTSRRRLLVSSLCMLLVAIVAMGTATFAWFTSSTTAKANGMNVKTIQASELVISDYTKSWGTTVNYEVADKVLMPASSANGSAWYSAVAADKTASTKTEADFQSVDAPVWNEVTSSSYAYKDQLNVKNNGAAAVENVTISWTIPANQNANYIRVALVPCDANGVEETGAFAANIYDNDGVAYAAASGAQATTSITPSTTWVIDDIGTLNQNEAKYFNLYVWFEGQDTECYDGNAGQIIADIEFSVSGKTVDQG